MISSQQNNFIKQIKSLKTKKGRTEHGLFFIEGERFVKEIPPDWPVHSYVISESFNNRNISVGLRNDVEILLVTDKVYSTVTDTMTPQGVMAVCGKKKHELSDVINNGNFFVIAESLSDPGNAGTLIRTADAMGADAIFFTGGSVDPYGPKTTRAAAGSVFHIPVFEDTELTEILTILRGKQVQITGTHLKGEIMLYDVDFLKPSCLIIGNEARGMTELAAGLCDILVKIPMAGMAESLNASVAGGIFMYEVIRQKRG